MKIILFDLEISGHHIKYASYLVRYLIEQGDSVTFITWKPCKLVNLLQNLPITIKYVVGSSGGNFGGNNIKRKWQLIKGFKYCFNLANIQQVDLEFFDHGYFYCIVVFIYSIQRVVFSVKYLIKNKANIGKKIIVKYTLIIFEDLNISIFYSFTSGRLP